MTGATTVWYSPLTEGIANIISITYQARGRVPSNLLPETLGVEAKWIILAACTVQQLWQLHSDTTALDAAARVFIFEDTRR